MRCCAVFGVSQSVVEGSVELRLGGWFSRCTMCLRVYSLVESFDEDLSRGVVDVDEYYREAVVRNMYLDAYYLAGRLNEVLVRHPELLRVLPGAAPMQSPDALYKLLGVLAGVLNRL